MHGHRFIISSDVVVHNHGRHLTAYLAAETGQGGVVVEGSPAAVEGTPAAVVGSRAAVVGRCDTVGLGSRAAVGF